MTGFSASQIRFTERSRTAAGAPASYWLLLAFLFLLYANLPLVMPALEVLRPAKVVAGLALVTLLAERAFARKSLEFAWPEGCLLLAFSGRRAHSSLTAPGLGRPRNPFRPGEDDHCLFFLVNCANTERQLQVMWTGHRMRPFGGRHPAKLPWASGRRPGRPSASRQSQRGGLRPCNCCL
jgi:hypothetical protein